MRAIRLHELVLVDENNFDEAAYLAANPDADAAVAAGQLASGRLHFALYGHREQRSMRSMCFEPGLDDLRAEKMEKLQPFLRLVLPHLNGPEV